MEAAGELRRIQEWMLTVVMNPRGVEAGVESEAAREIIPAGPESLEEVIHPSRNLSAMERLGVYANMYYWRLLDVLASDFPAVKHALGWDDFERTARGYLAAHPSTFFTLSRLGRGLPDYIATEADQVPHRDAVADVARVEAACDEVFDAERSPRLAPEELDAVAPEDWGDISLRTVAAMKVLALDHPANAYVQAVRDEEAPGIPAREPTWLLVRRAEDFTVWRSDLTREQFHLLEKLREGDSLAGALEAAVSQPDANVDEIMGSVGGWFQKWTAQGLFAAIES